MAVPVFVVGNACSHTDVSCDFEGVASLVKALHPSFVVFVCVGVDSNAPHPSSSFVSSFFCSDVLGVDSKAPHPSSFVSSLFCSDALGVDSNAPHPSSFASFLCYDELDVV